MRSIFVSIFLTWLTTTHAYSGTLLNEKEFAEQYVQVIEKIVPDAHFEIVGPLEVKITLPDKTEHSSFLNNAYADYQNNPDELDNLLATYAEAVSFSKDVQDESLTKEQILPVIKDQQFINQVRTMTEGSDKKAMVYEQLNDVLYVLYAFDTPKAIRFMTTGDLVKLGLEKDELLELSKANLRRSVPDLRSQGNPETLSILLADGTYEASFMLIDGLWTKEQFPVKGDIVVYVPTRDLVLITGSDDKESLMKVHEIVYDPSNQWSHMISNEGFVRKDNQWHVFKP